MPKKYKPEDWVNSFRKYGIINENQKKQLINIKIRFDNNKYKFKKYFLNARIIGFIENNVEDNLEYRLIKLHESGIGITLNKQILSYGEEEGNKKWNEYCKKQAYTNSFEYKNKKYGMNREEFNKYNKNRSVTLSNMIKRYGEEEGNKKWNEYCKKQAYAGCNLNYFIEKYGEEEGNKKWEIINESKKHNLENMIKRYGEKEGKKQYKKYIMNNLTGYSKISQELFWNLYNQINNDDNTKIYFQELNNEFGKYDKDLKSYKKYDFVYIKGNIKFCIEYNGDHYHGNPNLYKPNDFLKGRGQKKIKAIDKWKEDDKKIKLLKKSGFDVIIIWDSDFTQNKEKTIEKIKGFINEKYGSCIFR
jgi:hypothetical protein